MRTSVANQRPAPAHRSSAPWSRSGIPSRPCRRPRKPREIDPGPTDGEARKAKTDQACDEMTLCEDGGDLGGGKTEAGRKRQVEQQFKRRGGAVHLVRIASDQALRVDHESASSSTS